MREIPPLRKSTPSGWPHLGVTVLPPVSQWMVVYGALMALACGFTFFISLNDARTLREVGIWVKPMKFMAATALFEVAYISCQASLGAASHYNTSDPWHAFLFGLMGFAAVGLTASQAWLAWEMWAARGESPLSISAWGVIVGLVLTFVLSTVSGFLLGGHQPPAGPGLPLVGWHLQQDIRPSHFLGVHAQQLLPL